MTDKRYTGITGSDVESHIVEKLQGDKISSWLDVNDAAALLNEQQEQIKTLEKEVEKFKDLWLLEGV